jgi:ATP-dependent DNA helicase DinG
MRRWLIGADSGRLRGLRRRVEDLVAGDSAASEALQAILEAARMLPGEGWQRRVSEGSPSGPLERFLIEVRVLVRARTKSVDSPHGLEADCSTVCCGPCGPSLSASPSAWWTRPIRWIRRPASASRR